MPTPPKVVINGFGRIGRLVTRALLESDQPVDIVAINDLTAPETLAHLFAYDSVHGHWPGRVDQNGDELVLDGDRLRVLREPDPSKLPLADLEADFVVECTGRFRKRDQLQPMLDHGAKRVILSAPPKDEIDVTLVRGVNMDTFDPDKHRLVSNASCTTNCLAPTLKVLHERFGVEHAVMTTVHAYTNGQVLLDTPQDDLRRARAAGLSMIPTTTGAASAIGKVLPELDGKVDGMAIRVPVPNVSLVDLTARLSRETSRREVVDAYCNEAAQMGLQGILRCEERPLVSVDYNHDPASAVIDLPSLMVVDRSLAKVLAWYDNEWGFSNRLAELVHDLWAREHGTQMPADAAPT